MFILGSAFGGFCGCIKCSVRLYSDCRYIVTGSSLILVFQATSMTIPCHYEDPPSREKQKLNKELNGKFMHNDPHVIHH